MDKFFSRKFLISAAAFLASISGAVTGLATGNETLQTVGLVCSVLSAAFYAAGEALVDAASVKTTTTTTTITAQASQSAAKALTDSVLKKE